MIVRFLSEVAAAIIVASNTQGCTRNIHAHTTTVGIPLQNSRIYILLKLVGITFSMPSHPVLLLYQRKPEASFQYLSKIEVSVTSYHTFNLFVLPLF